MKKGKEWMRLNGGMEEKIKFEGNWKEMDADATIVRNVGRMKPNEKDNME